MKSVFEILSAIHLYTSIFTGTSIYLQESNFATCLSAKYSSMLNAALTNKYYI